MPKLLHLRCSPRASSASSAAAEAFLTKFRQVKPSWDIDLQDLWRETLPEFDGAALEAKYARLGGRSFSDPERDAFAVVERLALRFLLAERVLISLPMWNFGVPYKLKQWFDLIVQPGLTFSFSPFFMRNSVSIRARCMVLVSSSAVSASTPGITITNSSPP